MKERYRVYGYSVRGNKLYWNKDEGWMCNDYDATVYDDASKADSACYIAEDTLTIEGVTEITFEKC